jgi:hypothetical protein
LHWRDLVEPRHVTEWLPSGPCRITVWGHDVPIAAADVEVRAGDIVPAEIDVSGAERVRVTLDEVGPDVASEGDIVLAHLSWSDELGREIATDDHYFQGAAKLGFTRSLLPGRYGLCVTTATGYCGETEFEVQAGLAPVPVHVVLRR